MGYILYFSHGILDSEASEETCEKKLKRERKMQFIKENSRKIMSVTVKVMTILYLFVIATVGTAESIVPDKITVTEEQINNASVNVDGIVESTTEADAKLFGVVPVKKVEIEVIPQSRLIPCGNVFGVKFFTKGVIVIKLSDIETSEGAMSPAKIAGLETGDIIQSVNGEEINTAEQMASIIEKNKGKEIDVRYLREENEYSTVITPVLSLSDRKYKTGIWVRDSTAGIGTMTYYNPSTGEFAGLGHGICDIDTGKLMPLLKGNVVDVEITDIIKGRSGSPGELKGTFDTVKRGDVVKNTEHGVYGLIDSQDYITSEPLEIGLGNEVVTGKAEIMCELDGTGVNKYEIEITKIKNNDREGKNFLISVTDEKLIEKTGGIVQGMSGSPIIQNGKIVGAVTHVLVNSPTKGYGIFIENMLAQSPAE